jgi:hypothetical protein
MDDFLLLLNMSLAEKIDTPDLTLNLFTKGYRLLYQAWNHYRLIKINPSPDAATALPVSPMGNRYLKVALQIPNT